MADISRRYRETSIDAANKARLVQMLLGRAMQHARAGAGAAAEGRIEARFKENQRIAEIIAVLRGHLDLQRGGAIARQLDAIYGHVQVVLMRIDVHGDAGLYDHVLALLSDLERAWAEIASNPAPAAQPVPAAAEAGPRPAPDGGARAGFSLRA